MAAGRWLYPMPFAKACRRYPDDEMIARRQQTQGGADTLTKAG
jgi:hypothetical protein